ncbi:hypothetical protein R0135_16055 [Congregibacter variabilis]|uniref:Sigma-E factor negative regulatory protein RseA n=1 Tax=Congregibacter variabilis TaxID=3081200 RepID=A0ABZ0I3C0_9GAMM|nr:hypothetical protein R0135_16055 [Congregibacter sp. IMCC43200]
MQQRLNNRWLSEELIAAVRLSSEELNALTQPPFDSELEPRSELQSTQQGHRRMWQHIATVLLLLGSAAFSYLAWSQAELPPNLSNSPGQALGPPSELVDQTNVHALRVANRELQLRIAELQARIAKTAP